MKETKASDALKNEKVEATPARKRGSTVQAAIKKMEAYSATAADVLIGLMMDKDCKVNERFNAAKYILEGPNKMRAMIANPETSAATLSRRADGNADKAKITPLFSLIEGAKDL